MNRDDSERTDSRDQSTELVATSGGNQEALTALHSATRDLMQEDTSTEIAKVAVNATDEILGFSEIFLYTWDAVEGVLKPSAYTENISNRYDGEPPVMDGGDSLLWRVFVEGELRNVDDVRTQTNLYNPDTPIRGALIVPLGNYGVLFAGTTQEGGPNAMTTELVEILAANTRTALERSTRKRTLAKKKEQLQRTNEQLAELKRINDVIREIDQVLVRASHRREIEETVCEQLTTINGYDLAWFGVQQPDSNQLTVQARAGDTEGYLDIVLTATSGSSPTVPAERVLQTDEVSFTQNILNIDDAISWRRHALDCGFRSVASIPIVFRDTTYGVLELYTHRPSAFSDEEQSVLKELGTTIGNAINAIERKEALLADGFIELTLQIPDSNEVIVHLANRVECELSIDTFVPRPDGTWLMYFTVPSEKAEQVLETAHQFPSVSCIDQVRSVEESELFGLVLAEFPSANVLAEQGASLKSVTARDGDATIVVTIPQEYDVREFVEQCRAAFTEVELLRRKQYVEGMETPHEQIVELLTEKQCDVLVAALEGGYFAWPRDMTGEELAESLGVSPPTFHRHIRTGLEKLVHSAIGQ